MPGWSTDRMWDKAATPVLNFGEDIARHQAGGGAAQDDVFARQTLYVLEDVLLDVKPLEDALLEDMHARKQAEKRPQSYFEKWSIAIHPLSCQKFFSF